MPHDLEGLRCSAASALVAPSAAVDLFAWAREEAAAARREEQRVADLTERLQRCEETLAETGEWQEAERAREDLKESKDAALNASHDVAADRDVLKVKRKALRQVEAFKEARKLRKAIQSSEDLRAGAERRVVNALADGRVPKTVVLSGGRSVEVVLPSGKDAAAGR